MPSKMRKVHLWQGDSSGLWMSEIPSHGMNNVGYHYGIWSHAYLANLGGPDALLQSFYPNLNGLGHDGTFFET
jgi:hypothetical protein